MEETEKWMNRCLELAALGLGTAAPNPMVGAVIVHEGRIAGEGYHQRYGELHAEVLAIKDALEKNPALDFAATTMYVNLEPCNHQGKTPPCSEEIIRRKIGRIVIGIPDPNPLVNGSGIKRLRENGVEVIEGVLSREAADLNRRFITFHRKFRPYVILKFAQSMDGFLSAKNVTPENRWLTNSYSRKLVHRWRSEEQAVLVGTNTVRIDDPLLTVRDWSGRNPIRVVPDRTLSLSPEMKIFNSDAETIVFNEMEDKQNGNIEYVETEFNQQLVHSMLKKLHDRNIQSVLVEGGSNMLSQFIRENCWDEARFFIADKWLGEGTAAPAIQGQIVREELIYSDKLVWMHNTNNSAAKS